MSKNSGFIKMSSIKSWGHCKQYDKYLRGELEKQKEEGLIKTHSDLYDGFNCNRDMFTETTMSYMKFYHPDKDFERKVYCFTNTYHPLDRVENGGKLTPEMAHKISTKLMSDVVKDYPALEVTHIDKDHLHTQFIIGNVNINDGKSFQFSKNDLIKLKEKYADLLKEYELTNSLTTMKERPYKDKETKKTIYPDKEKTPSIGELKVKERNGYTNKDVIGLSLKNALENAKNFEELHDILKSKYQITIEQRGKKHYTFSHPDNVDKKGRLIKIRENNLGEYSMSREEIEKQFEINKKNELEKFEKMSDAERQNYLLRRMDYDNRNRLVQSREIIQNDYDDTKEQAFNNANEMKQNAVAYKQSRNDIERHKLMREREKLYDIQKELQNKMEELGKKFDEVQEQIKELDKDIKNKWDDRDNRIINDDEYMYKLPLDSDINKLPQTVAIDSEYDNARNGEDVLSVHDMNGAEEIYKGLKEQERLSNGNEHRQSGTGTSRENNEKETRKSYSRTESIDREMGEDLQGPENGKRKSTEQERGIDKASSNLGASSTTNNETGETNRNSGTGENYEIINSHSLHI